MVIFLGLTFIKNARHVQAEVTILKNFHNQLQMSIALHGHGP
jgi:hypothetical protein